MPARGTLVFLLRNFLSSALQKVSNDNIHQPARRGHLIPISASSSVFPEASCRPGSDPVNLTAAIGDVSSDDKNSRYAQSVDKGLRISLLTRLSNTELVGVSQRRGRLSAFVVILYEI